MLKSLRAAFLSLAVVPVAHSAVTVDPALPPYKPATMPTGQFKVVGSKSGSVVLVKWQEALVNLQPGIKIEIDTKRGSSSAYPALLKGEAQLAPMSRPMEAGKIDEFTKTYGHPPTEIRFGVAPIAVVVHPSNPIRSLTRTQLDAIFSNSYEIAKYALLSWGETCLGGAWFDRKIVVLSLDKEGGPYGLFRREAMTLAGDLKETARQFKSEAELLAAVANDPAAIGFVPLGAATKGVRIVPIAEDGGAAVYPTLQTALNETYPLRAFFRFYINKPAYESVPAPLAEFIRYGLSREGQQFMADTGYFPLPASYAQKMLEKLN
jgi:phosphate transport system substrate-binding protein